MSSAEVLWTKPGIWREIQGAFDHHVRLYAGQDAVLLWLTGSIADNLQALGPVMDEVCAGTCPQCPDPCCLHADVRYDFRDLVFLHCRQEALPLHQPKQHPGQPCSFLGRKGCVLPRSLRPFLCTWYVCPRQMKALRDAQSPDMAYLQARLHSIQEGRKNLEAEFINLVASGETGS